jgi:hypothetical protein
MLDVIIGARPVRREYVGQSMGLVEVEVKRVATRDDLRGAAGAAEGEETKRRGGYRRWPAPGSALATLVRA